MVGTAIGLLAWAGVVVAVSRSTPISRGVIPRPPLPSSLASPSTHAANPAPKSTISSVALGPLLSGPVQPVRLVIPSLSVDAPIIPESVSPSGSLGVPEDPTTLGWWSTGPEPGSPAGTAVIDGHVDSAVLGLGALFHLQTLVPGDEVAVMTAGGSELFTVDAVRQYAKSQLGSEGVFDQALGGRLVLVTCGGPFDESTHTYRDNVVVFTTPTPA